MTPIDAFEAVRNAVLRHTDDPDYARAFLERQDQALKILILEAWPTRPVPRREDHHICADCNGYIVPPGREPEPHRAFGPHRCSGSRYRPLHPPGDFADDLTWNSYQARQTARWGLCGDCGRIVRLYVAGVYAGRLSNHSRPLDPEKDGRKRREPDCEGIRQFPVVSTRGPQ